LYFKIVFQGGSETDRNNAAKFLGLEARSKLLRIELTKIVSKYVRETEKNLQKLFEKGASLNAILFFDEADALFDGLRFPGKVHTVDDDPSRRGFEHTRHHFDSRRLAGAVRSKKPKDGALPYP